MKQYLKPAVNSCVENLFIGHLQGTGQLNVTCSGTECSYRLESNCFYGDNAWHVNVMAAAVNVSEEGLNCYATLGPTTLSGRTGNYITTCNEDVSIWSFNFTSIQTVMCSEPVVLYCAGAAEAPECDQF